MSDISFSTPEWKLDEQGRKIVYLTPSILKDIKCLRFFYLSSLLGLRRKGAELRNYKAAYGNAFGMFCDDFHSGLSHDDSTIRAKAYYEKFDEEITDEKEWRTLTHLIRTMRKYSQEVTPETFTPLKIGEDFATQLTIDIPITVGNGYVYRLAGTIDKFCKYATYPQVIVDDKTTGSYNIKLFFEQYKLSLQMLTYIFLGTKFLKGEDSTDWLPFVINGIFVKYPTKKAEMQGIFDGATFVRHGPEQVTNALMESFLRWVKGICSQLDIMLNLMDSTLIDYPNYNCCSGSFGKGCEFSPLCRFGDVEQMKLMIPSIYDIGKFSPTIISLSGGSDESLDEYNL